MSSMNDENEIQVKSVPTGAVMSLLSTNTMQRNNAEYSLQQSQNKVRTQQALHIKTLGRLFKHQGAEIIDEVLEYAKEEGMFISCDSEKIGILSIIKDYTNKQKNTFQAHFTIYGKYIDKVGKDNLDPKSYKGYFLYKNYEEQFKKYINYNVTEFDKIEDLFDFEKKEAEPEPEKIVEKDMNPDKKKKKCCVCTKMKVWKYEVIDNGSKFWCDDCVKTDWT
jgi:hypothetical protein